MQWGKKSVSSLLILFTSCCCGHVCYRGWLAMQQEDLTQAPLFCWRGTTVDDCVFIPQCQFVYLLPNLDHDHLKTRMPIMRTPMCVTYAGTSIANDLHILCMERTTSGASHLLSVACLGRQFSQVVASPPLPPPQVICNVVEQCVCLWEREREGHLLHANPLYFAIFIGIMYWNACHLPFSLSLTPPHCQSKFLESFFFSLS